MRLKQLTILALLLALLGSAAYGATPQTVEQQISGKHVREKANIKGVEIAKIGSIAKTDRANYSIEITEINPMEGGVEFFARAWDANGQIGFGPDGTILIQTLGL